MGFLLEHNENPPEKESQTVGVMGLWLHNIDFAPNNRCFQYETLAQFD